MSKLAAAIAANRPKYGTPCPVAALLDTLKPADRAELEQALAAGTSVVGHSVLQKAIKAVHGATLPDQALGKHRRNQCRCARG